MRFISVLFCAAWIALAATDAAHAGPIGAAIGALGTFLASGTIAAQFVGLLLATALRIGVGLLEKALQKDQPAAGIKTQVQTGGDNPLSLILGHFATPGQLVYANTYGQAGKTPNAYLTLVIALSDLPLANLTGVWVNDKKCTLPDFSGPETNTQGWAVDEFTTDGGSNHHLWLRWHDGTETVADSFLTSTFGSDPDRPFTSDMIGRGVAYVVAVVQFDQELFSGIPSFVFETDGMRLYDIRKDSTAGGSGAHRWTDQTTWEPSDNPIVQAYNIVRGVTYAGTWLYGGQTISAYQLPAANWMAAANACDQTITNADGSTEPQFRTGYEVTTDKQPLDTVEELLKGCNGRMAEVGGIFKVTVGAPAAPVYSFTDETIIVTEGQSFDPFPGLENTVNGAHASYPEPQEKWAAKDAPPYLRSDLETADDGRRLLADVQLGAVPYPLQVQRILKAIVEDHRRFRQHQHYLPPEAWVLEPNDVVAWTSDRNGYSNKKFIVTAIDGGSSLIQGISLKEVDPSDYSWDAGADEQPYSVGILGEIIPPAQIVTGWQVLPAVFYDTSGKERRPSIEVFFAGGQIDVDSIRVQVRLKSSGAVVFDSTVPYDAPLDQQYSVILNGIFLPNTDYEVRGVYVSISARPFTWSAWLTVTTPNVLFGRGDIYDGIIDRAALAQDVKDLEDFAGQAAQDLIDQLMAVVAKTIDQDAGQYRDKQTFQRNLRSQYKQVTAEYSQAITVATGPDSALATEITQLQSEIDGAVSTASTVYATEVTDLSGVVTATSNAIEKVDATVGNFSAEGLFRVTAEATNTGAQATIGLSVSATGAGATQTASLFLDAMSDGTSRIIAVADKFIIADPNTAGNILSPFVFTGGVGYLQNLKVQAADIVNLTVDWADITNVDITSAQIGTATIETINVAADQITGNTAMSAPQTQLNTSWVTLASVAFDNPNPKPVLTYFDCTIWCPAANGTIVECRLRRVEDNYVIRDYTTQSGSPQRFFEFFPDNNMRQGTNTYVIEGRVSGAGATSYAYANAVLQWNKR